MKEIKTGLLYSDIYNHHYTGNGAGYMNFADKLPGAEWLEGGQFYEGPNRLRPLKAILDRSGFIKELTDIEPRHATREELLYAHTPEYIDKIKYLSDHEGGLAGVRTYIGIGSYEIITMAVGGALAGLDAIMSGTVTNAFSLSRPPAGHAERDHGEGFCPVNTYNIAAHYARKKYGIRKIAIVDYCDHWKAGIYHEWESDPDTLYIECHESDFPGSVKADKVGEGAGRGYTVPVPLPSGSGTDIYVRVFEEVVGPVLDQFKPELIILAAGYASNMHDPMYGQKVTSSGYKRMTEIVREAADRHCSGRLLAILEGGGGEYMPICYIRTMEALKGKDSIVTDVYEEDFNARATRAGESIAAPSTDQANALARVKAVQSQFWKIS